MRMINKAVVIVLVSLPVALGVAPVTLRAQAGSGTDSQFFAPGQTEGGLVAGVSRGARGLGYLFRPGQASTRNLWLRSLHPEQWQTTAREREAARAAFSLILAVVVFAGAITWVAGKVRRWRPSRTGARSISGERARVSLAGGR